MIVENKLVMTEEVLVSSHLLDTTK